MDIASNAVNLFNTAIECFGRIQLARAFEQEFATHQLKLDVIQIRLSRWGEVAGINKKGPDAGAVGDKDQAPDSPGKQAERLLEAIQDTFSKAMTDANKMKAQIGRGGDEALDPEAYVPYHLKKVRTKLHECLRKRRAQAAKVVCSMKWAFYKREHFEKFVTDISGLVESLESLFPEERQKELQQLSSEECRDFTKPNLEELQEIAKDCDPWLKDAVDEQLRKGRDSGVSISQHGNIGQTTGIHNGNVYGVSNGTGNTNHNYWGRR